MSHDIDLRKLKCPVSTMRLKKHLRTVPVGATFRVLADDADARIDFPPLFEKSGVEFLSFREHDEGYHSYEVRKDK